MKNRFKKTDPLLSEPKSSVMGSIIKWTAFHHTYINPFCFQLNIDFLEYVKIYILTVLIVPLRVIGVFITLFLGWFFASIGMCGCTIEEMNEKPLTGWRKKIQKMSELCIRSAFASASFHWITFKGKKATSTEAPIFVIAPHSSFADAIIVSVLGPPAIVAKRETAAIPLLGKVITFSQPIYVQREDANSRQSTARTIVSRATSNGLWPQIAIFPEGTCTNRKALIKFKPGAFSAGVPVQPILLRYPNNYDTFTWTWEGPSAYRLLWLTMAHFYSNCEIEFLPVYVPNEEEKSNPNLYANNVRGVMADALGVPTSEYSFEDVVMMERALHMKIPFSGDIIEIERILFYMNYLDTGRFATLIPKYFHVKTRARMEFWELAAFLNVDENDPDLQLLFHILEENHAGFINLRHFLLCGIFCECKSQETMMMLKAIKDLYVRKCAYISHNDFQRILMHAEHMKKKDITKLFTAIDENNRNRVTFDDFENYVRDRPEYEYLFKKHPHMRRHFQKKQEIYKEDNIL